MAARDGVILFAGTPLGNAEDASGRLAAAIASADLIATEDTRKFRALAERMRVQPRGKVVSHFEANESVRLQELVDAAAHGSTVLVLTDAGMPSVSDPGYRLVRAAIDADVPITALPGPSAVTTALVLSGLPVDRFCFEGFLPRKSSERGTRLASLAAETRTMVFFEAPHRLVESLQAMVAAFGANRSVAVCRELTKTYEEVLRGTLVELIDAIGEGVRGEITIVVAGANAEDLRVARGLVDESDWVRAVAEREASGISRRDAIAEVAKAAARPRREVYDAVIRTKLAP
ncbi:MAG: 16S rRNA (cytidine(1402)-2'-O)-methyltransferase [Actinobacteria bacterium]|nr:16S rRNA (cytidine(1402)-2'-O)-methyltransferase [Actinomycetota bacterium]